MNDLAHSVLDMVTLGGLRRFADQLYGSATGRRESTGKLLVGGIDGVVNQVSLAVVSE